MPDDGTMDRTKGKLKEAAGGLKHAIGDAADKIKHAVNPKH
jgi:uncharacterized protein YjbJ (UPF0337 family)